MSDDSEVAYAEAKRRIAAWREGEPLDLSIRGLDRIPPEIGECAGLEILDIRGRPLAILESDLEWSLPLFDLGPLSALTSLTSLDCSKTEVSDLTPLAGLACLAELVCYRTPISDLAPLAGLAALESLSCPVTLVADLAPLSGLLIS